MKDCTNAKVGDKVISRDGSMTGVVIGVGLDYEYPLAIKITSINGRKGHTAIFRRADGVLFTGEESPSDLFLVPVKKTMWVRMLRSIHDPRPFPSGAHATRRDAEWDAHDPSVEVLPAVEYTYEE